MTENGKIVIVGAGMGGLTAAAYLTKAGYDVLLVDKNDRYGGLVSTFKYEDFWFDSGPRAYVNSGMVKPMLKDLGIDWELLENRVSIGIEDQLFRVESMDSIEDYKRMLCSLYPDDQEDIEKLMAYTIQLSEYTKVLYEFDNPNFGDLTSDPKYIFRKLIPWTFKFLIAMRKMNQFNLPMEGFLQKIAANRSLTDVMTQLFFRNTPTYFALGYFYVYLDYFYPKGGTGALARLLSEKVLDGGGKIELNRQIVEVRPAQSMLVDSEGGQIRYDQLIWAADLKTLYRLLNMEGLDEKTTSAIESESRRMFAAKGAESVYLIFAGVDRPPAWFKARGGEHMFYTPSKQGLGDTHLEARQDLIDNFEKKSKAEVLDWLKRYLDLNTFEISIPALRDPSLAPEGKTGIMISCLFDHSIVEKIDKAGWYQEFKQFAEDHIIKLLSQSIYKGFAQDILFKFSSTPRTIHQLSGSSEGAITGWSFEGEVPVVNQLKDIPKSALTTIPNVYKAGQWAYAPAGVPIAMLTGWYASQKIIKGS